MTGRATIFFLLFFLGCGLGARPDFDPWLPSDISSTHLIINVSNDCALAKKGYMYPSSMVRNTNYWGALENRYFSLSHYASDMLMFGNHRYNTPGVWYDSNVDGPSCSVRYDQILSTFGKSHIATVLSHYRQSRQFLKDTPDITIGLDFLEFSGTQIFSTFAQSIDINGLPVDYSTRSPLTQGVAGAFNALINGASPTALYGSPGAVIDPSLLGAFFNTLIMVLGANDAQAQQDAGEIAQWIGQMLGSNLFFPVNGKPFAFISAWNPLMVDHQRRAVANIDTVLNFVENGQIDEKACTKMATMHRHSDVHAKQLTAFFAAFHGVMHLFDRLVPPTLSTGPRLYNGTQTSRMAQITETFQGLRAAWTIHTHLFVDNALASATKDFNGVHESFINIMSFCNLMSENLAQTVCYLDKTLRQRNLFDYMDNVWETMVSRQIELPPDFGKILVSDK